MTMVGEAEKTKDSFRFEVQIINPFSKMEDKLLLGVNRTSQGKKPWVGLEHKERTIANYLTPEVLDEIIIVLMYMKK